jgi:hypothetical protein
MNDREGSNLPVPGGEGGKVRNRRILPVAVGAGERPFTEPITAVRRRRRDRRATTALIDLPPGEPPEGKLDEGKG